MSRVTLKQIEAFVAVADLGTFRRAAERLNTTQPNISARIAQLELLLGVRLMQRDAGSVRLTPQGRNLLVHARKTLAALDGFIGAAGDPGLYEGVLHLGVSELVAHTWLHPFLREMRERFPAIDVELTVGLSAELSEGLFSRALDLTIQNGPFERAADVTVPLGSSPYIWVANPTLVKTGPLCLGDHPVLTHARATTPFLQIADHVRRESIDARLVPSSNIITCLQMCLDGFGVTCLPKDLVTEQLSDGRLIALDYPWQLDDLHFFARTLSDPAPGYLRKAIEIAQSLSPPNDQFS